MDRGAKRQCGSKGRGCCAVRGVQHARGHSRAAARCPCAPCATAAWCHTISGAAARGASCCVNCAAPSLLSSAAYRQRAPATPRWQPLSQPRSAHSLLSLPPQWGQADRWLYRCAALSPGTLQRAARHCRHSRCGRLLEHAAAACQSTPLPPPAAQMCAPAAPAAGALSPAARPSKSSSAWPWPPASLLHDAPAAIRATPCRP